MFIDKMHFCVVVWCNTEQFTIVMNYLSALYMNFVLCIFIESAITVLAIMNM